MADLRDLTGRLVVTIIIHLLVTRQGLLGHTDLIALLRPVQRLHQAVDPRLPMEDLLHIQVLKFDSTKQSISRFLMETKSSF